MTDSEADQALVDRVVRDHLLQAWAYGMKAPTPQDTFPTVGNALADWHARRAAILRCMPLADAAEAVRRQLLDGLTPAGPTLRQMLAELLAIKESMSSAAVTDKVNEIIRRFDR